ncbi:hypothetical protein A2U01_0056742, partial [Trifolium medium]|nr:hypothetical protein [Trifolium medium]
CVGNEGGLVKPKYEAEPCCWKWDVARRQVSRQAICALQISPVLASRRETFWSFFARSRQATVGDRK